MPSPENRVAEVIPKHPLRPVFRRRLIGAQPALLFDGRAVLPLQFQRAFEPVARLFLDLGMHPGPLLAYLMADPELSLQSMLMVGAVIGRTKAAAYVALVAGFSVVAGLLHGAAHDGARWARHARR